MNKLKLLIVEGNTKEENLNFNAAGCVSQSQNFKQHIQKLEPNCEIQVVEPGDDSSISKIVSLLKKYNGIILTGSTLRVNDNSSEIKKHIHFAKKCFENEQKIFASCWGLQITVTAAGGKCRVSPNGAHIGIAEDIEITNEGKKHKIYFSKPDKLQETRVQPLNRTNAVQVQVTRGSDQRTLVRQNPADFRNSFWADPKKPDKKDAAAGQ